MTYKRILVGLDGSPAGWNAAEWAFLLALRMDVPVVGIHVIDEGLLEEAFLEDLAGVLGFIPPQGFTTKVRDFLEEQAGIIVDEFLKLGRERGVKVSSLQTVGKPYKVLIEQADKEDLLIVGREGKRPVRGLFLGSTSEMIVRRAACHVMVVPEGKAKLEKVCVAFDGSSQSVKAVQVAKEIAQKGGVEVRALYVGDEDIRLEDDSVVYVRLRGLPEEKLVEYCKEEGMDLLVAGRTSRSVVSELFLGSVATFLLHHSPVALLLVR
ncbi:UspA domain protein [Thermocrinis albus DSM 14484]|uniref:UspA domain protein n=1 Tax=Thermocrinis albus (strain DSM 14484 / JCM 11386 / HI 11/12) TaxID=638303 RepID=D3SMP8_THEAH|nr:universal stress protein [Thermocrinis albus]ADC90028.1 UspA domain protein [Thermocrinis albus DSM 14484]